MKRYIYTITCSLAFLVTAPVIQANATSVETSGGMVRTHLDAQSKPENQPSNNPLKKTSVNEALNEESSKSQSGNNVNSSNLSSNEPYPAYCKPLSPGLRPEDWQYKESLYKCKYGS